MVHLGEVGGPKVQRDIEVRQAVAQAAGIERMKTHDGIKPAGLQVDTYCMLVGERAQAALVARRQRFEVTHDQHGEIVADRQFDLRQAIRLRQAGNQFLQRRDQQRDMRRQDRAGIHHCDVAAALLMETDQNAALLRHVAHRQAGAPPVAPGGTGNRRQHCFRTQPRQMPQRVFEHALLDCCLRAHFEMLHAAAATDAEMRTVRFDALTGGFENGLGRGLLERRLASIARINNQFTGQAALDENSLAIHMGDAAPFVIQRFDQCLRHGGSVELVA